jgi:hypothetical protein
MTPPEPPWSSGSHALAHCLGDSMCIDGDYPHQAPWIFVSVVLGSHGKAYPSRSAPEGWPVRILGPGQRHILPSPSLTSWNECNDFDSTSSRTRLSPTRHHTCHCMLMILSATYPLFVILQRPSGRHIPTLCLPPNLRRKVDITGHPKTE